MFEKIRSLIIPARIVAIIISALVITFGVYIALGVLNGILSAFPLGTVIIAIIMFAITVGRRLPIIGTARAIIIIGGGLLSVFVLSVGTAFLAEHIWIVTVASIIIVGLMVNNEDIANVASKYQNQ